MKRAVEGALAPLAEACRERGLSATHQRLVVFEAVAATRTHPAVDEVYRDVLPRCPSISRGTVYRILSDLCGAGLLQELRGPNGAIRYEAAREPHHHLVCVTCRGMFDLHAPALSRAAEKARRAARRSEETAGFEVTGLQIQFTGYCRRCRPSRRAGSGRAGLSTREG